MSVESSNVMLGVVSLSMRLGKKYCEEYSHQNSPKRFTQRQLLTCLILKAYTKSTYRGVVELLEVSIATQNRMLEPCRRVCSLNGIFHPLLAMIASATESELAKYIECLKAGIACFAIDYPNKFTLVLGNGSSF